MNEPATGNSLLDTVTRLVTPIVSDLKLELYDLELRSGTLRITLDTPPGAAGNVDLDMLALATRLISKELDAQDPLPGRYTLEVTSPGLERSLRTPAHFQRALGSTVAIRLSNVENAERRLTGVLQAADATSCTVRLTEPAGGDKSTVGTERTVAYDTIDRARTVHAWASNPKPGKGPSKRAAKPASPDQPTDHRTSDEAVATFDEAQGST